MSLTIEDIATGLQREYHIDAATALRKAQQIAGITIASGEMRAVADILAMPQIPWPFTLRIPWSHLVSDNEHTAAIIKGKAVPLRTKRYREAKRALRRHAQAALGRGIYEPATYPLEVTAHVWVPDAIRAYDVSNIGKCLLDALETVVYTKDHWAYRTHWLREGVDVDAPRAELTICRIDPDAMRCAAGLPGLRQKRTEVVT
jgi:hypothetical protein